MNNSGSQAEPKKRSRRFYIVLIATISLLAIISGAVILEFFSVNQTTPGPGPVDIEVTADKLSYMQGEEITFEIYVSNPQDWPVEYPYSIRYVIEKDVHVIYSVDEYASYPPDAVPTFSANSRTSFNWSWNQKTYLNGTLVQVEPGNYALTVSFDVLGYSNSGNCTFEIRPN